MKSFWYCLFFTACTQAISHPQQAVKSQSPYTTKLQSWARSSSLANTGAVTLAVYALPYAHAACLIRACLYRLSSKIIIWLSSQECSPFLQVWGTKAVRIYPPESKHSLYPYPSGPLRNTSQIHATASVDHSQFPDFLGTKGIEVELKPGQALYMPPKHWHEVVSLSGSLSLSYWWI